MNKFDRKAGLLAALGLTLWGAAAQASPGVTLTDANDSSHPVTYTAGPFVAPNNLPVGGCDQVSPCDDTTLTLNVSPATAATKRVVVRIDWQTTVYADFDLYIQQGSNSITASASTTDPEIARFAANNGAYTVHVVPYQPSGSTYTATIFLETIPGNTTVNAGPKARYQVYAPPASLGSVGNGGEPSIGTNWKTGSTVIGNSSDALFVKWDDGASPAIDTWASRPPFTNLVSFDPILFTDRVTGRTIASQLVSDVVLFTAGCSLSSYTDDDGATWIPSEGCGPPSGADHQAIGGGPLHAPLPGLGPVYPNAVYYCSQEFGAVIGDATCSRSDDGGFTYGPGVVVYTTECGGLHGHPRVAPDGTVYLPNKDCVGAVGLGQGVVVSKDNGLTWSFGIVPGSIPGDSDPSVATGLNDIGKPAGQSGNTVYLGYCDGDGHAKVAISRDQGATWGAGMDVGSAAGIQNCVFPEMIAGDDNRAAMFFIGTPTPGAFQASDFAGEWHAYVATTYDGGATWGLSDATPNDPVQIGCIWMQGGSNDCRNLLDFNDIALDQQGRPNFVFADGCLAPACGPGSAPSTSHQARDTIGRQSGGRTLFSAFDTTIGGRVVPAAPKLLGASGDASGVSLGWAVPDDGGSPLSGYRVYRGTASNQETLLASIGPAKPVYLDTSTESGKTYFYKVTAINANGEGGSYQELQAAGTGSGGSSSSSSSGGSGSSSSSSSSSSGGGSSSSSSGSSSGGTSSGGGSSSSSSSGSSSSSSSGGSSGGATQPPSAALQASPVTGTAPLLVYFDASASSDPNSGGSITAYAFDFGDGSSATVSAPHISHTYQHPGSYTATVTVTDSEGDHASASAVIRAQSAQSDYPAASLQASTTDGAAPLAVNFDASGSHEANGSITGYVFDFGDGSPTVSQTTATTSHSYTAAGSYQASVTVTNSFGNSAAAYVPIHVSTSVVVTPPAGPVAELSVSPNSGSAPLTVTLDGSHSYDGDSSAHIVSYTFSFGDGSAAVTQSTPAINHVYTQPGTYSPSLYVTDSKSQRSAVAMAQAQVTPGSGDGGSGSSGGGGGAFAPALALPLLLGAALRRRRRRG